MPRRLWNAVLVAALTAAVLLTGCTSKSSSSSQATASGKPPLAIPKHFADAQAEQEFAAKAVQDGYYKEAQTLLTEVATSHPSDINYQLLGTAKYNLNDFDGAIQAWSQAAKLNSSLAGQMQNNIANALRDQHKAEEAKEAYRTALKLDPTCWTAAINLANVLHLEGKTAEAVTVLKQAAETTNADPVQSLLKVYQSETASKTANG